MCSRTLTAALSEHMWEPLPDGRQLCDGPQSTHSAYLISQQCAVCLARLQHVTAGPQQSQYAKLVIIPLVKAYRIAITQRAQTSDLVTAFNTYNGNPLAAIKQYFTALLSAHHLTTLLTDMCNTSVFQTVDSNTHSQASTDMHEVPTRGAQHSLVQIASRSTRTIGTSIRTLKQVAQQLQGAPATKSASPTNSAGSLMTEQLQLYQALIDQMTTEAITATVQGLVSLVNDFMRAFVIAGAHLDDLNRQDIADVTILLSGVLKASKETTTPLSHLRYSTQVCIQFGEQTQAALARDLVSVTQAGGATLLDDFADIVNIMQSLCNPAAVKLRAVCQLLALPTAQVLSLHMAIEVRSSVGAT